MKAYAIPLKSQLNQCPVNHYSKGEINVSAFTLSASTSDFFSNHMFSTLTRSNLACNSSRSDIHPGFMRTRELTNVDDRVKSSVTSSRKLDEGDDAFHRLAIDVWSRSAVASTTTAVLDQSMTVAVKLLAVSSISKCDLVLLNEWVERTTASWPAQLPQYWQSEGGGGSKHGMLKTTHQAWGPGRARTDLREPERSRVMAREVVRRVKRILAIFMQWRTWGGRRSKELWDGSCGVVRACGREVTLREESWTKRNRKKRFMLGDSSVVENHETSFVYLYVIEPVFAVFTPLFMNSLE